MTFLYAALTFAMDDLIKIVRKRGNFANGSEKKGAPFLTWLTTMSYVTSKNKQFNRVPGVFFV